VYRSPAAGRTVYERYIRITSTSIAVNTVGDHVKIHIDAGAPVADLRSDAEVIAEMAAGNGDALGIFFHRYVRLVYRVALDILRDTGEAEDVTQDVFLEIFRKAHRYDASRGSGRVWLLQYAYHRALRRKSALRTRAAYRGAPLDEAEEAGAGLERGRLSRDECRWMLRAGLARLSERQRSTLELACFEELSLRDVAERLGVSVGCTRHYYYRGLARLQAWAQPGRLPRPDGSRVRRAATAPCVSAGGGAGDAKSRGRSLCARG
jgi:RNA polymerase sigma-70 factor (ECF subfamily)